MPNCSWSGRSVCAEKAFLEKKIYHHRRVICWFQRTRPFKLVEILNDFPLSKLWNNLSFKSFSNSFVVNEEDLNRWVGMREHSIWSASSQETWIEELDSGTTKSLVYKPRDSRGMVSILWWWWHESELKMLFWAEGLETSFLASGYWLWTPLPRVSSYSKQRYLKRICKASWSQSKLWSDSL